MLVLAALWWAWSVYAWLTSAMDVDEGGVRLAMLASTGAMLIVALAVPGAFGDDAVLFGAALPRRAPPSSRPLRDRHPRRSRAQWRACSVHADRDLRPLAVGASRFPRRGRPDRIVGRRACDRLPRPGRDRRRARLACSTGALRRTA